MVTQCRSQHSNECIDTPQCASGFEMEGQSDGQRAGCRNGQNGYEQKCEFPTPPVGVKGQAGYSLSLFLSLAELST